MRILIIGSTGFIGSHLALTAAAHNIEVVALSRRGSCHDGVDQAFAWSLGELVPMSACKGVSCAIHLAHDFDGEEGAHRTIESTLVIASQLQAAGITRQLFFSSYSAGKHASSIYGRTKFTIEESLKGKKDFVIVRPGLVLGEGGLYGRILKWARILPLIPLPDGGRGKVPVIEVEKLCDLTLKLAFDPVIPLEANLFEHELESLRELVIAAAQKANNRPWIFPISAAWLIGLLKLATRLHIPIPVNADNLSGFLANQSATHQSTIEKDKLK